MDYLEFFNDQIQRLKKADYSHLLIKKLEDQQIPVIAKASKMAIPKGPIPFLPVLPELAFRFSELMPKMLNYPNFGETTFLKPKHLTDIIPFPRDEPYYIFGVEDGIRATRGKSPKRAEELFLAAGRRGLTLLEGLALFMHCGDLPQNYCLWTLSSRLVIGGRPPYYVALLVQRRALQRIYSSPTLDSRVSDFGPFITPSCQPLNPD